MTRDEATEAYINEIQSHMDRAYQELANLTDLDSLGFVRDYLARAIDLIDYEGPEAYLESLRPEQEPDTSLGFPRYGDHKDSYAWQKSQEIKDLGRMEVSLEKPSDSKPHSETEYHYINGEGPKNEK